MSTNNLQGRQLTERIKELMGGTTLIKTNVDRSVFEFTKRSDDGDVYAIVRENHEYYIKKSRTPEMPTKDSFDYVGGLKNKKDYAYPSYSKALKQLNFKFNSISESLGSKNNQNMFLNENIIVEEVEDDVMEEIDMTEDESRVDEVIGVDKTDGVDDIKINESMSIISSIDKIDAVSEVSNMFAKLSLDEIDTLLERVKSVKKKSI